MAESVTIARPYADAAFKLAKENGAQGIWSQRLQRLALIAQDDFRHHSRPILCLVLPEQANATGIPGGMFALQPPAPVSTQPWQHDPARFTERTGDMGDCRIHRNHQIKLVDDCRGIRKILNQATQRHQGHPCRWRFRLIFACPLLQADPGNALNRQIRDKQNGRGEIVVHRMHGKIGKRVNRRFQPLPHIARDIIKIAVREAVDRTTRCRKRQANIGR